MIFNINSNFNYENNIDPVPFDLNPIFDDLPLIPQQEVIRELLLPAGEVLDHNQLHALSLLLGGDQFSFNNLSHMPAFRVFELLNNFNDNSFINPPLNSLSIGNIISGNRRNVVNSGNFSYWSNRIYNNNNIESSESDLEEYDQFNDNINNSYIARFNDRVDQEYSQMYNREEVNELRELLGVMDRSFSYSQARYRLFNRNAFQEPFDNRTNLLGAINSSIIENIQGYRNRDLIELSRNLGNRPDINRDNDAGLNISTIVNRYNLNISSVRNNMDLNNVYGNARNANQWINRTFNNRLLQISMIELDRHINDMRIREFNAQHGNLNYSNLIRQRQPVEVIPEEFFRLDALYKKSPNRMLPAHLMQYFRYRRTYSRTEKERQGWHYLIGLYLYDERYGYNKPADFHDLRDGLPWGERYSYYESYINWRTNNREDIEYFLWSDEIKNFLIFHRKPKKKSILFKPKNMFDKVNRANGSLVFNAMDNFVTTKQNPNYTLGNYGRSYKYKDEIFTKELKFEIDKITIPSDVRINDDFVLEAPIYPGTETLHNYIGLDLWDNLITNRDLRHISFDPHIVASRNIVRTYSLDHNIDNRIEIIRKHREISKEYIDIPRWNKMIDYIEAYEKLAMNELLAQLPEGSVELIKGTGNYIMKPEFGLDYSTKTSRQLAYTMSLLGKRKISIQHRLKPPKILNRAQRKAQLRIQQQRIADRNYELKRDKQQQLEKWFFTEADKAFVDDIVNKEPYDPTFRNTIVEEIRNLRDDNLDDYVDPLADPVYPQPLNNVSSEGHEVFKYMRKRKYKAMYNEPNPQPPRRKMPVYQKSPTDTIADSYKFFFVNSIPTKDRIPMLIDYYFDGIINTETKYYANAILTSSRNLFYEISNREEVNNKIDYILNNYVGSGKFNIQK